MTPSSCRNCQSSRDPRGRSKFPDFLISSLFFFCFIDMIYGRVRAPDARSASRRSARLICRTKSIYSVTRRSAQIHPPRVMAAICRKTLNCGVSPRYTREVGEIHSENPSIGRWKRRERRYSRENGEGRGRGWELGTGGLGVGAEKMNG